MFYLNGGFYEDSVVGSVKITDDEHAAIFDAQSKGGDFGFGGIVSVDANGKPFFQSYQKPVDYDILQQITKLETSITPRRRDEAILGIDNSWLKNTRDQIATLRKQLTNG